MVATVLILGQPSVRADTSNVMEDRSGCSFLAGRVLSDPSARAFRPGVRSAESVDSSVSGGKTRPTRAGRPSRSGFPVDPEPPTDIVDRRDRAASGVRFTSVCAGRGPKRTSTEREPRWSAARLFTRELCGRVRRGRRTCVDVVLASPRPVRDGPGSGDSPAGPGPGRGPLARYVPKPDSLFFYLEFDGLDGRTRPPGNSSAYKLLNDTKLGD